MLKAWFYAVLLYIFWVKIAKSLLSEDYFDKEESNNMDLRCDFILFVVFSQVIKNTFEIRLESLKE